MSKIDIKALRATTDAVQNQRALDQQEKEKQEALVAQSEADKIIAKIPGICEEEAKAGQEVATVAVITCDMKAWGTAQGQPKTIYCQRSNYGDDSIERAVLPCYPIVYAWCKEMGLSPKWIYTPSSDACWTIHLQVSW